MNELPDQWIIENPDDPEDPANDPVLASGEDDSELPSGESYAAPTPKRGIFPFNFLRSSRN